MGGGFGSICDVWVGLARFVKFFFFNVIVVCCVGMLGWLRCCIFDDGVGGVWDGFGKVFWACGVWVVFGFDVLYLLLLVCCGVFGVYV